MSSFTRQIVSLPVGVCCVLPGILVALWYSQVYAYGYVWDDLRIFGEPSVFQDARSIWSWMSSPFLNYAIYFRPLALLTLAIDYRLGAGLPSLPHLTNVALHVLNTVLVGCLGIQLARRDAATAGATRCAALVAGFFYGFHPALIESVCWISARFDLMVTTFALAALLCDRAVVRPALRAIAVGMLFLGGALCKEMILGLALLLPLWHLCWHQGRPLQIWLRRDNLAVYAACLAGGLAYLLIRAQFLPEILGGETLQSSASLVQRILLVGKTMGRYLALAFWPFSGLSPAHLLTGPVTPRDAEAWAGFAAAALLLTGAFQPQARARRLALLGLCFLLGLTPVLQILPLTIEGFVTERFLTMPLIFAALAMAEGARLAFFEARPGYYRPLVLVVAVAWISLTGMTQAQIVPVWRNEESFWPYAYSRAPASPNMAANLMAVYMDRGEFARALEFAEELRDRQGGQFYTMQQINYAYLLSMQGRHEEAQGYIAGAEGAMDPGDRHTAHALRQNWGFVAMNAGDLAQAEAQYRQALVLAPANAESLYYLGVVLAAQGRDGAAELAQALDMTTPIKSQQWQLQAPRDIDVARAKAAARRAGKPP